MLKLGEKIISDIYLGDKKIAKVFWGDKLVYQSGKPIFLDYIIADGKSYIDTGYIANENSEFEYTYHTTTPNTWYFGSRTTTTGSGVGFGFHANTAFSSFGAVFAGKSAISGSPIIGKKNVITLNKNNLSINDVDCTSIAGFGNTFATKTVKLFTIDSTSSIDTRMYQGQCYGWKIRENGVLIQDLRPCIHPNGTVCFYDTVTNKYFYNQGTGELKKGGRFVKSIVFDGASYIDTGIKYQTCTVKTETKFSLTGTRQLMGFSGSSPIHYWGCNTSGYLDPLTSVSGLEFKEIEVAYNKDNADNKTLTITVGGKSAVKTGKLDTTNSYLIGCIEYGSYSAQCEVKYNKIYVNGELIQDLRPYVDTDGVACFKDLVTGNLFYNKGTGTLTYTE